MRPHAILLVLLLTESFLVLVAPPAAANADPCRDIDVHVGYVPVLEANPCTQGTAYVCVLRNKQGDFNCTPIGLWCWCPGPVLA
jgi:hypothetical protein